MTDGGHNVNSYREIFLVNRGSFTMSDISLQVSTGQPDEQMHTRAGYIQFRNPINNLPTIHNTKPGGRVGETMNPSTRETLEGKDER